MSDNTITTKDAIRLICLALMQQDHISDEVFKKIRDIYIEDIKILDNTKDEVEE